MITERDAELLHPRRMSIALALELGELRLNELEIEAEATPGSLHAHLERLKEIGYIAEREGRLVRKSRFFHLTMDGREGLTRTRAWIAPREADYPEADAEE